MILTPLPLDNPWKRAAIGFFMFNMSSTLMVWIALDIKKFPQLPVEKLFFLISLVSVAMFFSGKIFPVIDRAKFFVLILGVFGILPILFSCALPFFLYISISKFSFKIEFFFISMYIFISFFWIYISIKKTASVEKSCNYIRSQINSNNGKKFIDRENLTDFSNLEKSQSTKKNNIIKNIIIPLAILVYPLQKIISGLGGDAAVFGAVSILSVPLSWYIIGKIASGYYLWVYCIGKLEKEYKSNILLVKCNPVS